MINHSRPIPTNLVWDNTVSYKRAWRLFWAILQDEAIALTRSHTADELGLLHLLFTAAEFQAINGTAPILLANPGQANANATRVALANLAIARSEYSIQQDGIATLHAWLLATIPKDLLAPMKVDNSMRTRSILYIVTALREELGTLTIQDSQELLQALRVPYVYPESVRAHLNTLKGLFAELAANQQPVPNNQAVTIIKEGFPIPMYMPCWIEFARTHPTLAQQTPAALYVAIVAFSENILPLTSGPIGTAASAYVATHTHAVSPPLGYIAVTDVQVMIDKALAAAKIGTPKAPKKATAGASGKMYCWSHGPEHTHEGRVYAHTSQDCKSPAPGHCKDATFKNMMGGATSPARYRYLG